MAGRIVGDKDCSVAKIVDTIMASPGSEELLEKWHPLSTALETPGMKRQKLLQNLRMDMITMDAALETILTEWRCRMTKNATLEALITVLRGKDLNQIAENLEEKFLAKDEGDCGAVPEIIQYVPSPTEPNAQFWTSYYQEKEDEYSCKPEDFDLRMVREHFDVKVVKPKNSMDFSDDHYKLPTGFKGYALILNVIQFEDENQSRAGAKHDSHNMETLWNQLGYKVVMYDDGIFTSQRVSKIIRDFKRKLEDEQDQISSFVMYIGSHGESNNVQWSDGSMLNLYDDIVYQFNTANCPALQGRPKIFIVSTCQGFQSDSARKPQRDCVKENQGREPLLHMKPIDDTVVCLGSLPGYFSYRHAWLGSVFGYSLTKVFEEEAHRTDLLKMLNMTEERMRKVNVEKFDTAQDQMPNYQVMGMKTLYFNMRPSQNANNEEN